MAKTRRKGGRYGEAGFRYNKYAMIGRMRAFDRAMVEKLLELSEQMCPEDGVRWAIDNIDNETRRELQRMCRERIIAEVGGIHGYCSEDESRTAGDTFAHELAWGDDDAHILYYLVPDGRERKLVGAGALAKRRREAIDRRVERKGNAVVQSWLDLIHSGDPNGGGGDGEGDKDGV